MLIDLVKTEYLTTNPIEIAEVIEQSFGKEVNIDYVETYLELNEKHDERKSRKAKYYFKSTSSDIH